MKGWGKLAGKGQVEVALLDGSSATLDTKDIILATGSEVSPLPGLTIDEDRCAHATQRCLALLQTANNVVLDCSG